MSGEHRHNFEAKYTREDGKMVIQSPCTCTECDKLAFIRYDGYKIIVTFVPTCEQVSYTVTAVEDKPGQPTQPPQQGGKQP